MANRSSAPTPDQVQLAEKLAGLMEKMVSSGRDIERSFNAQSQAAKQMAENMERVAAGDIGTQLTQINETLKLVVDALQKLQQTSETAFSSLARNAETAAGASRNLSGEIRRTADSISNIESTPFEDLIDGLKDTGKNALTLEQKISSLGNYLKKEFPVATGAALGALSGLKQGFNNLVAMGKSVFGFLGSLVDGLFEVGKSILAIPFKIFDGLIDMAHKGGGGISEWAKAVENLRKEFGDLNGPVSSTLMATAKQMKGATAAGVSVVQLFGNAAERLEQLTKLFTTGGAALQSFTKEFEENGGALLEYQKGLGLTDENMGVVAQQAKAMGKPMGDLLNDMTKQSVDMGKAFGVSAKLISKDMGKAMQDMKHFATVSVKEIGVASTYARKLGLELDKIVGTLDAFETFDSAAESVSKLNEAFGTNLDAAKLMNASSPAEQLDMLRKQFRAAGIDGEKLSRAQLKLLSQNSQLDEGTLRVALSSKNAGVSMEKLRKQAGASEKKSVSQTEALNNLANAMERMLKAGEQRQGGFLDQFFKGITDGITSTKEFWTIMMNIKKSMTIVYVEGRRLGRAIVEMFPGLKDFFGAIGGFFDPQKFKGLAKGVTDVFIGWMKSLNDPHGNASFASLMDNLQKKFFEFFDKEKPGGKKLLDSFTKITDTISKIIGSFAEYVMQKMTGFIRDIIQFIKNPNSVPGVGQVKDAGMGFISPLLDAIASAGPALWDALSDLMSVAFDKLSAWAQRSLLPKLMPLFPIVAMILFGPAFTQAILGALVGALTTAMVKGIAAAATKAATSGALGSAAKKLADAASAAPTSGPGNVSGALGTTRAAVEAAPNTAATTQAQATGAVINGPMIIKLLLALAGIIAIGMAAFFASVAIIRSYNISTEEIIKAMMILGTVAVESVALAGTLWILGKVPVPNPATTGKGILAIGAIALVLGALGVGIAYMTKVVTLTDVLKATTLLIGMSIASIALGLSLAALVAVGAAVGGPQAGYIVIGLVAVGVVAFALGALGVGLAYLVKESKINLQEVTAVVALLIGMSIAVVALGVSLAAIMAAGALLTGPQALLLGVGLVAVGLAAWGLFGLAKDLVKSAVGIDEEKTKKASSSIISTAEVILSVLAAMGALAIAGLGGIALALPAIAGFDVLKLAIPAIGEIAQTLGEQAGKLPDNVEKKVGPFKEIIEAITNVVVALSPKSFSEAFQTVDDDDFDKLPGVFTTMDTVLGRILPQVSTMIRDIVDASKAIGSSDKALKGVSAIGGALGAVGQLAAALSPKGFDAAFKTVDDDDFEKLPGVFGKMNEQIDLMKGSISTLATNVINILTNMPEMSKDKLQGIDAVSHLMSSLGPLATALQPNQETSQIITKFASSDDPSKLSDVLGKLGTYMSSIAEALTKPNGIIDAFTGSLGKAMQSLNGIDIKESSLKGLQAIGPLIGEMMKIVSSLMSSVGSAMKDGFDIHKAVAVEKVINSLTENMPKIFSSLGSGFSHVIESVKAAADNMPTDPQFIKKIETVGKGLDLVAKLNEISNSMPKIDSSGNADIEGTVRGISSAAIFMMRIAGRPEYGTSMPPIKELFFWLQKLVGLVGGPTAVSLKPVEDIGKIVTTVKNMMDDFVAFTKLPDQEELVKGVSNVAVGLTNAYPDIAVIFANLSSITNTINTFGGDKLKKSAGELPGVFSNIRTLVGEISELDKLEISSGENMGKVGELIEKAFGDKKSSIFVKLSTGIATVAGTLGVIKTTTPRLTETIGSIKEIVGALDIGKILNPQDQLQNFREYTTFAFEAIQIVGTFSDWMKDSLKLVSSVMANDVANSVKNFQKVLTSAQKFADALGSKKTMDIGAKLQAFSSALGVNLGATNKMTVQTKDVNITVNIRVAMDTQELEKIMVSRKESLIKNRINLIIDALPQSATASNSTPSSPDEKATASLKAHGKFKDSDNSLVVS